MTVLSEQLLAPPPPSLPFSRTKKMNVKTWLKLSKNQGKVHQTEVSRRPPAVCPALCVFALVDSCSAVFRFYLHKRVIVFCLEAIN